MHMPVNVEKGPIIITIIIIIIIIIIIRTLLTGQPSLPTYLLTYLPIDIMFDALTRVCAPTLRLLPLAVL